MPESPTSTSALAASTATSHGATLTFEDVGASPGAYHRHEGRDALLRVIAGLVSLSAPDRDLVLAPGEEAIVRAGTGYRLTSVYGVARVVTGLRPVPR